MATHSGVAMAGGCHYKPGLAMKKKRLHVAIEQFGRGLDVVCCDASMNIPRLWFGISAFCFGGGDRIRGLVDDITQSSIVRRSSRHRNKVCC